MSEVVERANPVGGVSARTGVTGRRQAFCARPGCQGPTAAWLTYDYAGQRVWLDDAPSVEGDQWALCAGHAGRLLAPQGWTQVDRRVARPAGQLAS